MPNPKIPHHNSRSFDPDKGLPLIGKRDCHIVGQGAAKEATTEHQMYDNGKEIKVVVNESLQKRHMRNK